jgi:hypothetical protein
VHNPVKLSCSSSFPLTPSLWRNQASRPPTLSPSEDPEHPTNKPQHPESHKLELTDYAVSYVLFPDIILTVSSLPVVLSSNRADQTAHISTLIPSEDTFRQQLTRDTRLNLPLCLVKALMNSCGSSSPVFAILKMGR